MGLPSPAAEPVPTNKQSVLLPVHPPQALVNNQHGVPQSGPSGPPCSGEVGSLPRTCPRGVASGSSTSGSSSCSINLAGKVGKEVNTDAGPPRSPPGPATPSERSPVHCSLDALVPCEGQSLLPGGRNTVNSAREPWCWSGWGVQPEARLGERPVRSAIPAGQGLRGCLTRVPWGSPSR